MKTPSIPHYIVPNRLLWISNERIFLYWIIVKRVHSEISRIWKCWYCYNIIYLMNLVGIYPFITIIKPLRYSVARFSYFHQITIRTNERAFVTYNKETKPLIEGYFLLNLSSSITCQWRITHIHCFTKRVLSWKSLALHIAHIWHKLAWTFYALRFHV